MAKSVSVPTAAAAGMTYMTWVLSAIDVGFAASAVARNTHSAIGIAHLVVSSLSLVIASSVCCISTHDGGARQAATFIVLFFNMLLYIAIVIPLSINHISKPDIRAGQGQLFNKSLSDTERKSSLTGHPYYGMYFVDILMICKTAFGFLVLGLWGCCS